MVKGNQKSTNLTPYGDTSIAIVSGVQDYSPSVKTVSEDVRMVRSALLYADRIDLFSVGTSLLFQLRQINSLSNEDVAVWMLSLIADAEACPPERRESIRQTLEVYKKYKEKRDQFNRQTWRKSPDLEGWRQVEKDAVKVLRQSSAQVKSQFSTMWHSSGGAEIDAAIDAGIVTLQTEWVDRFTGLLNDNDHDELVNTLVDVIESSQGALMFDQMAGGIVSAMEKEKRYQLPRFRQEDIRSTRLGAGMILKLPNLAGVETDKILEVREEITPTLIDYRRSVGKINSLLHEGPFSPDLDAEIDSVWKNDVRYRVDELTDAVFDSKLGRAKDAVVAGLKKGVEAVAWSGVTVGVGMLPSIDWSETINYGAWGGAVAGGAVTVESAKSSVEKMKEHWRLSQANEEKARKDGLFYLADINRTAGK